MKLSLVLIVLFVFCLPLVALGIAGYALFMHNYLAGIGWLIVALLLRKHFHG